MGVIAGWLFYRSSGFLGYALASIFLVAGLIALINAFVNPGRSGRENENNRLAGSVMHHPSLGKLKFDGEGIWTGEAMLSGKRLEIAIAGNLEGPDRVLTESLLGKIKAMPTLQKKIVEFVRAQLATVKGVDVRDFETDSLDFLWPERPNYFMVRLHSEKDPGGIWKVEFVDDAPKYLSRDD